MKHGGGSISIWGCFAILGLGHHYIIRGWGDCICVMATVHDFKLRTTSFLLSKHREKSS